MTTPENRNIQDLSTGRLADGEDSQGLYSTDRRGRRWYHVDHIDGYSGRIIFYHNIEREQGLRSVPGHNQPLERLISNGFENVQKRRTRGGGRKIRPKQV